MKEKILNVWSSDPGDLKYYEAEPFYKNGEWEIHKMPRGSYLYSHKKVAFTERAAANPSLIDSLAEDGVREDNGMVAVEVYESGNKFRT